MSSRRPHRMQGQMDAKMAVYQPDGSGRDYYICRMQGAGKEGGLGQSKRAEFKPVGGQSLNQTDILSGAPVGPTKNVPSEKLAIVAAKPQAFPSDHPVISDIRQKICARGGREGFRGLSRILRIMDDNGNKQLSPEELMSGLQTYGIYPTPQQMEGIVGYFDRDGSGQISVTEFVRGIREPMNAARRDLVLQAFALIDVTTDGRATFGELRSLYDTSQHPDVIAGTKTPQQVMSEFTKAWDKSGDNVITAEEFIDYYEDLSAGIDNDSYFELMIRNAWHISGGEGWAANTTCRRVLVMHKDGSQTTEEVMNDLGLSANDTAGIRARLEAQGVGDIASVITAVNPDAAKRSKFQEQPKPHAIKPQSADRVVRQELDEDRSLPAHAMRGPPNMWKTTNKDMFKVPEPESDVQLPQMSGYMGHRPGNPYL